MQAPLAALALVLELTHSGFQIMAPMIAAVVDRHRSHPARGRLLHLFGPTLRKMSQFGVDDQGSIPYWVVR